MVSGDDRKPDVSVVIITVGRPSLYGLLRVLERQQTDFAYEVVVVANGPVEPEKLAGDGVRVLYEESGMGIPYYRNVGTASARGRVIVHTDDDIMPRDELWLSRLAGPILEGRERVTVSSTYIPQGQGLLADLISMLGYPGGGSLGWRAIYDVDEDGYTDKLPSGNCAIEKTLLEEVGGFDERLAIGASDALLGEELLARGIKLLYVDEAILLHEPRSDFLGFLRWQVRRGMAVYDLNSVKPLRELSRRHVKGRLKRTWVIVERVFPSWRIVPMVGILIVEYVCHALGYAWQWARMSLARRGRDACA